MSSNQIDQCRQPATCTGRCLGGQGYPDSGGSRFENAGVARAFPGLANPLEGGIDVIATAYIWTERPVWVGGEEGHLLFSDVPGNAIYSWDGKRTTVFLAPSGYQGFPIPASLREAGSNGLALGRGGLLIADSGTRALARGIHFFSGAAAAVPSYLFPSNRDEFQRLKDEASISRLFGGIHYRSDLEVGKEHGKRLAGYTVRFARTDGAANPLRTTTTGEVK